MGNELCRPLVLYCPHPTQVSPPPSPVPGTPGSRMDSTDHDELATARGDAAAERVEDPFNAAGAGEPSTRTSLKYHHSLGFCRSGGDAAAHGGSTLIDHLNDDCLVYLTGKHVAVYSYASQKSHRFILKNPKTSRVVAFCVSANRRYVALSEVLHPEPNGGIQVSVYNFSTASKVRELGRGRFPSSPEGAQPPVVGLHFSRDNKYLVTVTEAPDPQIYLWQLDKQRLAGMSAIPHAVSQVTISPWAHWELCTTGTSVLRLWRAQGSQLKSTDPVTREPSKAYRYTCHTWFDSEKLIAGTVEGDVLVIDGQELKLVLPAVLGPGRGVHCLCAVSRGFLAGGNEASLSLFERTYDAQHFRFFKAMQTPDRVSAATAKVIDVSISPGEETAVVCYDNNEIAQLGLDQLGQLSEGDRTDKHNVFKRLPIGFHCDAVTGADVCAQKSVVVTASVDKHIRVWNFVQKTLEIDKKFDEDVLSVAIHPSGCILAAGFRYKLCIFVVLASDLQLVHEFAQIKQCREVRFSHGGQYFAAVGNPWSRIVIVNAYTFQPLGSRDNPNGLLTGHSASVQSICWSRNDKQLISAGSEGAIYEWRITSTGGKRNEVNESVIKSVNYQCVRYDDDSQMLVGLAAQKAAAADKGGEAGIYDNEITLRTMRFSLEHPPKAPQRVLSNPIRVSMQTTEGKASKQPKRSCQVAISSLAQTLFLGTSDGQLWLYEWPPTDQAGATPEPYCKMEVHQGEVMVVLLTLDERHLFTIGAEDRCLFMFNVDTIAEGRPVARKPYPYTAFDCVAFISQQEYEERGRMARELASHHDELIRHQQGELAALREEQAQALAAVGSETAAEMAAMQQAKEASVAEAEEAKALALQREQATTEAHMKTAEELEALHTKRVEEMDGRHRALSEDKDDLVVRYENKLHKLRAEIASEQKQIEFQFKETEQRLAHDVEQLQRETREQHKNINGLLDTTVCSWGGGGTYSEIPQMHPNPDPRLHLRARRWPRRGRPSRAMDSNPCGEGGPMLAVQDEHRTLQDATGETQERGTCPRPQTALFFFHSFSPPPPLNLTSFHPLPSTCHTSQVKELELHIEKRREQERLLVQKAQEHAKANEGLKAEIAQRNDTISASERRILELKKQTADLEKLRYVLTYKFSELRKEVAPKEERIKAMNESIQAMDLELERIGIDRDVLQHQLTEKDTKIAQLMSGLGSYSKSLDDKERSTEQLLRELISLVSEMNPKGMQQRLKEVVDRYSVRYDDEMDSSYEREKSQEFERQRSYMEGRLSAVEDSNKQKESSLRHDNQVKTIENAQLVKEINVMRQEKKQLTQRLQQADSQLKELHAQAQRLACNSQIRSGTHAAAGGVRPASAPAPQQSRAGQASGAGGRSRKGVFEAGTHRHDAAASVPPLQRGNGRGPVKGRLVRGSTRALRDICDMNPQKLQEILDQVDQTNACIRKQKGEIGRLKDYVKQLLQGAEKATANADLLSTVLPSVVP